MAGSARRRVRSVPPFGTSTTTRGGPAGDCGPLAMFRAAASPEVAANGVSQPRLRTLRLAGSSPSPSTPSAAHRGVTSTTSSAASKSPIYVLCSRRLSHVVVVLRSACSLHRPRPRSLCLLRRPPFTSRAPCTPRRFVQSRAVAFVLPGPSFPPVVPSSASLSASSLSSASSSPSTRSSPFLRAAVASAVRVLSGPPRRVRPLRPSSRPPRIATTAA